MIMAEDADWIVSTDQQLIASIIKHEGDKQVIYRELRTGRLKAAPDCDAQACMQQGTWPAYVDSEGLDTVGIGHLITGQEPFDCYAGVSNEQVMQQLSTDLETHLAAAKRLAEEHGMNIAGNHVVQRFMTEMCFNIGALRYANFKNGLLKLTSAVNDDGQFTYNDAADEHLDSRWARQVGNRAREMVDKLRVMDEARLT
jgi:lysozyme